MATFLPPRDSVSVMNRPSLNWLVEVMRNSAVVPCVKTPRTWFCPNFTLRIVFIVGTAMTSCEFGVASMMRCSSTA